MSTQTDADDDILVQTTPKLKKKIREFIACINEASDLLEHADSIFQELNKMRTVDDHFVGMKFDDPKFDYAWDVIANYAHEIPYGEEEMGYLFRACYRLKNL